MSFLLATTNPEAAAAIGIEKREHSLPRVGLPVIYHPRIGERRAGRDTFPAFVMDHMSENGVDMDSVELLILYGAEDQSTTKYVKPRSDENEHHCFEVVEPSVAISESQFMSAVGFDDEPFNALLDKFSDGDVGGVAGTPVLDGNVAELRREIDALRELIIGQYEAMPRSVYDMLSDLDAKVSKLVAPKRRGRPPAAKEAK